MGIIYKNGIQYGGKGEKGVGVPEGGTEGQVLAKKSGDDFDTKWVNPPQGSGTDGALTKEDADDLYLAKSDVVATPLSTVQTWFN